MGFFDSLFSDPFDFDGNGKRSADEDFMEYMMFNEVMNNSEEIDEEADMFPDYLDNGGFGFGRLRR